MLSVSSFGRSVFIFPWWTPSLVQNVIRNTQFAFVTKAGIEESTRGQFKEHFVYFPELSFHFLFVYMTRSKGNSPKLGHRWTNKPDQGFKVKCVLRYTWFFLHLLHENKIIYDI